MAYDKLIDSAQLDADLTSIADAIRAKTGGEEPLAFPDGFVDAVDAIQAGSGSAQQTYTFCGCIKFDTGEILHPDTGMVDLSNATSAYRGIGKPYVQYSNGPWEIGICFNNYSSTDKIFCFCGTYGHSYFANPSCELQNSTTVWGGFTSSSSSWDNNIGITLSEPVTQNNTYKVRQGWDGVKAYIEVKNISSNTVIGYDKIDTTVNPQRYHSSSYPLVFGNNALEGTSRFYFNGNVCLKGCYVKQNGSVIWGSDAL